jgi:glucose uptake protein GlcU
MLMFGYKSKPLPFTIKSIAASAVVYGTYLTTMHSVANASAPRGSAFSAGSLPGEDDVAIATSFVFHSVSQAINTFISVLFFGAALAAFVFIVIGAFQYVTAGDDAAKTEKSRKTITNAVVGLILVALVYVIFQIVIRIVPGLSDFFAEGGTPGTTPSGHQSGSGGPN